MKKNFGRIRKAILIACLLLLIVAGVVQAASTDDVVVYYTPSYLDVSVAPATWNVGTVNTSTNYTSGQGAFTATVTSSVTCNASISTVNATWTGAGNANTHSDTATAGANTVGLTSSNNSAAYDIVVKNGAPANKIWEDLPAGQDFDFELKFVSATTYDDGVLKGNAARITLSIP